MRTAIVAFFSAAIATTIPTPVQGAPLKNACSHRVGEFLPPTWFEKSFKMLPKAIDKHPAEIEVEFYARLTALRTKLQPEIILWREPYSEGEGLSYDKDKGTLQVNWTALGLSYGVDFYSMKPLLGVKGDLSIFSSIAFSLKSTEEVIGVRKTENAPGTTFNVAEVKRNFETIWEAPLADEQFPLVDQVDLTTLVEVAMDEKSAETLIKYNRIAFSMRPAYAAVGSGLLAAHPKRPYEYLDEISVIVGDIQCAFILHGDATVAVALEVK